jgi:hypothetical protein
MATGTAGTVARQFHTQQVHYLRKTIDEVSGSTITVGILPAGATILRTMSGIQINTIFSGTSPVADIGVTGTTQRWAASLDLDAAVAFLPRGVTTAVMTVAVDTPVICTLNLDTPTTADGSAEVIICYVPDNDG